MTIARAVTAEQANVVLNDPSVLPWIALPGQHTLDLSEMVAAPGNILLMAGPEGGFFFERLEPCVYEIHSFFVAAARGRGALQAFDEAMEWMFCRTDCMEVLTKVPVNNRAAEAFAERVGAVLEFERAKVWPTPDGLVGIKYYAMRYPDWVRQAPKLEERGHWFHKRLEAEKRRLNSPNVVHDDDAAHDRYVGACVAMIFGGQVEKAIILYNRWAVFAGYGLIGLSKREPLVIDIGEGELLVRGEDFEVVSVHDARDPSQSILQGASLPTDGGKVREPFP